MTNTASLTNKIVFMEEEKRPIIASSAHVVTIDIDGILGVPEEEQFGPDEGRISTYERFREALDEVGREGQKIDRLVLNIRSTGGCLEDALLIYDAAREIGAEVVTRCYGYVASAATIIAQAASKGEREISANALYLIHCCESSVEGNKHSLSATRELLDKSDRRLAEIYAEASSRPTEEFAKLMNRNNGKGVWLSPEEVLKAGLADRIIAPSPIKDEMREVVHTLGLTPLPGKSLATKLSEVWRSVLAMVGLSGSDSESGGDVLLPVNGSVEPSSAEKESIGAAPTPPSRLHTALPTRTKECEDPAPDAYSGALTPNESAYAADVEGLREALIRRS